MDGRQRTTAAIALLGALLVTFLLHVAANRAEIARVVPVLVVWGGLVLLLARRAPSLRHVLVGAVLIRVILVGSPPLLSDDLFRYLWEGHALLAGHDPLYTSPSELMALDPSLAPQIGPHVNHPDLPSVYPPLAMGWFALLVILGGTATTAQLAAMVADVVTVGALHRLDTRGAWLYALLPLPVVESAVGAHIYVPAATLATLGLIALQREQRVRGWGWLVAGTLTKLFPLVVLPTAWRQLRGPARWIVPAVAVGVSALLVLPFLRPEWPAGVVAYGTQWSFNGLLHLPLSYGLGPAARPLLALSGAAVGIGVALRARHVGTAWAVMGVTFVAITPTMHPWYLLWALIPTLALGRREVAAAAVFVPVSYGVLATWDEATGTWSAGPALWAATWLPALAAAVAVGWRDAASRIESQEAS